MPQLLAEGAMKLIRNGNKAAHTDVGVGSLTLSDANLSLLCVLSILHETIVRPPQLPTAPLMLARATPTMLPGDWMCKCGAHNFAVRSACRDCSAPKDTQAQQPQQPHSPDVEMMTTATPAITTTTTPMMLPGDWLCGQCGGHNFAVRTHCRSCGAPKGGATATLADSPAGHSGAPAPSPAIKPPAHLLPGDWICSRCQGHNFAVRTQCRDCGASKESAPLAATLPTPTPTTTFTTTTALGGGMLPGDWTCKECGCHNFAVRVACFGCHAPKEGGMTSSSSQPQPPSLPHTTTTTTTTTSSSTTGGVASVPMKSGDWLCPQCQAHNFASRQVCLACTAPRLALPWVCKCGESNFASRTVCRKCQSPSAWTSKQ